MKRFGNTILVVDDETPIREWIANCIKSYPGISRIETARNGEEAFKLFKTQQIDIILTDITMPRLDGLSLLAQVKQEQPDTTVVIMSVHSDFERARIALKNGAFDYILKNEITQDGLFTILDRICLDQTIPETADEATPASVDPIIRSQYIQNLLTDPGQTVKLEDLKLHKIELEDRPLLAMALPIIPESLPRIDRELSTHLSHTTFLTYGKTRLLILANCDADTKWVAQLAQVIGLVIGNPIGRSSLYPGVNNLATAIREALEHCDRLFYEPYSDSVLPQHSQEDEKAVKQDLEQMQNQVVEHYRQHRCDKAIECFHQVLTIVGQARLSDVEYIKDSIAMTTHRLFIGSKSLDIDIKSLENDINSARNLSDIKRSLEPLFLKMTACVTFAKPVSQVIEYISQNYMRAITLADVAELVHLNEEYCSRLFKKEVGINFTDYLLNLRMETARSLLMTTDLKIGRIAEMVGISDSKYFSLLFKKSFDQTPSQIRERQ